MREATFNSIIRVRNTRSALEAIIAMLALGFTKAQEALDARIFKLDPKFGWTLDDLRAMSRDKRYTKLIADGRAVAESLYAIQGQINESVEVVKAVKAHNKPKQPKQRKNNKRKEQVKAAKASGAQALAAHRAKMANKFTAVSTPAPKPEPKAEPVVDQKAELQAHIAQLLEDAKAVARKRSPKLIDEAQARLDRDVAAVLSQLG